MNCDPSLPTCYEGGEYTCQQLIAKMYISCDSVCLPDGYYFDPSKNYLQILT
jgi:hypothetical protein